MKKLFYLGPNGTYSELAALKVKNLLSQYDLTPISTIAKIINTVGEDDIAVLPIENLIDGVVRQTIDNIYSSSVKIQAQFDINIRHCLISKNNDKSKIKHIISHPQALAQCQLYILENFDENIDIICVNSTAQAGISLEEKDDTYSAITSNQLSKMLNLNILDENIGDVKDNKTRFVLISKKDLNIGKK